MVLVAASSNKSQNGMSRLISISLTSSEALKRTVKLVQKSELWATKRREYQG